MKPQSIFAQLIILVTLTFGACHKAKDIANFVDTTPKIINIQPFGDINATQTIGLTNKDISTTKGKFKDWGVMGLGFCPGKACVVSTFRLSKKETLDQLYKISVHELGHTHGLPHCTTKTCFMRDAEGKNPLKEETNFCPKCKLFLQTKGCTLH